MSTSRRQLFRGPPPHPTLAETSTKKNINLLHQFTNHTLPRKKTMEGYLSSGKNHVMCVVFQPWFPLDIWKTEKIRKHPSTKAALPCYKSGSHDLTKMPEISLGFATPRRRGGRRLLDACASKKSIAGISFAARACLFQD